jgi:hypothetical protein
MGQQKIPASAQWNRLDYFFFECNYSYLFLSPRSDRVQALCGSHIGCSSALLQQDMTFQFLPIVEGKNSPNKTAITYYTVSNWEGTMCSERPVPNTQFLTNKCIPQLSPQSFPPRFLTYYYQWVGGNMGEHLFAVNGADGLELHVLYEKIQSVIKRF